MDGLVECSQRFGIDFQRVSAVHGCGAFRKYGAVLVPVGIEILREEYFGEGSFDKFQCIENIVLTASPRSRSEQESVSPVTVPLEKGYRFGNVVRLYDLEGDLQLPGLSPESAIDLVQCHPFANLCGTYAYQV